MMIDTTCYECGRPFFGEPGTRCQDCEVKYQEALHDLIDDFRKQQNLNEDTPDDNKE